MAAASLSEEMSCLFDACFNDPPGTQSPPIQHTLVFHLRWDFKSTDMATADKH